MNRAELEANDRPAGWFAIYTYPRHEKAVAEYLASRAVQTFLPLYAATRQWNARRVVVHLPLFPSYVFVRISPNERLRVLRAPGVASIVTFHGEPAIISDDEVTALRTAIRVRRSQPHPYIRRGSRVRIRSGPLQGLEGIVVREKAQTSMIVSVDFIGRSVAIELDALDLECLQPVVDNPSNTFATSAQPG
ncbi:MAG: transcription termination/antitermination protein NusG [Terriglobales bacterium]